MPEQRDGLGMLEDRVARRRRAVPPPRHPGPLESQPETPAASGDGAEQAALAESPASGVAPGRNTPQVRSERPATAQHPNTKPDESLRNLAIRVRASLDERLNDLVYQLRREGVRTSKVELVEMLLWDLPAQAGTTIRARLDTFRRSAPRERY